MTNVPRAIGIIPDGNRRYAKEKGLSVAEGHHEGMKKVREVLLWAREAGVSQIWLYAFSTENWGRNKEEIDNLTALAETFCDTWLEKEPEGRIRFIGERERFSTLLQEKMVRSENHAALEGPTLIIALSYGGRAEIVAAVNKLLKDRASSVTEEEFGKALWSGAFLDPDLIIRTGGEKRLSNFLPWQSTYSELFFTDTKFPAFSKEEFLEILRLFTLRERRKGV